MKPWFIVMSLWLYVIFMIIIFSSGFLISEIGLRWKIILRTSSCEFWEDGAGCFVLLSFVACYRQSWWRSQSDARPTGDEQEVAGSIPAGFNKILSWRFIMNYFYCYLSVPLVQEGQLSFSCKALVFSLVSSLLWMRTSVRYIHVLKDLNCARGGIHFMIWGFTEFHYHSIVSTWLKLHWRRLKTPTNHNQHTCI